jgi:hypothetical protein
VIVNFDASNLDFDILTFDILDFDKITLHRCTIVELIFCGRSFRIKIRNCKTLGEASRLLLHGKLFIM